MADTIEYEIDSDGFVVVDIPPDAVEAAKKKAKEMGELKNSIRKGKGNVIGFLGEEMVCRVFEAVSQNTYQHDVKLPNGSTFEVKTKERRGPCFGSYEGSVAAYNTRQNADFYCFTSIKGDSKVERFETCYICGFIEPSRFYDIAEFKPYGQGEGNMSIQADCYNIFYYDLRTFK